jgi:alpha-L-fucosidase 2
MDTEQGHFWGETDLERRGRHAQRHGFTWPRRLLVLLIGLLVLAVGGGVTVDLLSSPSPVSDPVPSAGPAPTASPTPFPQSTAPAAKPRPRASPTAKPRPTVTAVAAAAPAPAGPVELLLAPYLDNVGVTSDSNSDIGNFDGDGESFSAQELAAAGLRGGAVITYQGVPFRWPAAAAGTADNVTAAGQSLAIRGTGSTLSFLVSAGWGPAGGTAKVVYANGSTQAFTISAPDWGCSSPSGPGVVAYTPDRDAAPGTGCVYYASVRLQAAQTVTGIVLPDTNTPQPQDGHPSLHIFAITIS